MEGGRQLGRAVASVEKDKGVAAGSERGSLPSSKRWTNIYCIYLSR
jgi:hypothetical protein